MSADRDLNAADKYVQRQDEAVAKILRDGSLADLRDAVRAAFLQGWHEAMNARDIEESEYGEGCPYCAADIDDDDDALGELVEVR